MKRIAIVLFALLVAKGLAAQNVIEDDFETNQYGWTETVSPKRGTALIKDGVMHMESKDERLMTTIYAPFDCNKPFVLTCEALVKKVTDNKVFGLVLDYEDEYNYICFYLNEGEAWLEGYQGGKLNALRHEATTLKSGKKVGIEFQVEYNLNELVFKVNGVKVLTYRKRIHENEFLLGTSGIGFFAKNGQIIDFDNLKIIQ